jgi:hypothetical protein
MDFYFSKSANYNGGQYISRSELLRFIFNPFGVGTYFTTGSTCGYSYKRENRDAPNKKSVYFLIVTDFGGNKNLKELREISVKKNLSLIN